MEEQFKACEVEPEYMGTVSYNYEVVIRNVENGFVISVGCKTFVFSDYDEMSSRLKQYYEDPGNTERLFRTGKLFNQ